MAVRTNARSSQRQHANQNQYANQNTRNLDSIYHEPRSADELTERNVETIARMEQAAQAKRTPTDRVVDIITGFCGRITFVWVHVAWFTFWILNNTLLHHRHFDPFPFNFLTLIVSLEAIFLSTFILISQNRQSRLAERRSHLDLQVNLLSEQENTKMLAMLEAIQKHLGVRDGDPEISILEESTQPDRLIEQIKKVIEAEPGRERRGKNKRGKNRWLKTVTGRARAAV